MISLCAKILPLPSGTDNFGTFIVKNIDTVCAAAKCVTSLPYVGQSWSQCKVVGYRSHALMLSNFILEAKY